MMKFKVLFALLICVILASAIQSCTKEITVTENDSLEVLDNIPVEEADVLLKDLINATATPKKRKYCTYKVTGTQGPDGTTCRFSIGDILCFRCNEDGCPPPPLTVGHNFGDGCRTWVKVSDSSCKEREDCAARYASW